MELQIAGIEVTLLVVTAIFAQPSLQTPNNHSVFSKNSQLSPAQSSKHLQNVDEEIIDADIIATWLPIRNDTKRPNFKVEIPYF